MSARGFAAFWSKHKLMLLTWQAAFLLYACKVSSYSRSLCVWLQLPKMFATLGGLATGTKEGAGLKGQAKLSPAIGGGLHHAASCLALKHVVVFHVQALPPGLLQRLHLKACLNQIAQRCWVRYLLPDVASAALCMSCPA